jgi:hypothetical protein
MLGGNEQEAGGRGGGRGCMRVQCAVYMENTNLLTSALRVQAADSQASLLSFSVTKMLSSTGVSSAQLWGTFALLNLCYLQYYQNNIHMKLL